MLAMVGKFPWIIFLKLQNSRLNTIIDTVLWKLENRKSLECSHCFETKIGNSPGIVSRSDFQPCIMHRLRHNSRNLSLIIIWRHMILVPWRHKLPLKARALEAALEAALVTLRPEKLITFLEEAFRIWWPNNIIVCRSDRRTAAPLGFLRWRVLVQIIRLPVEYLLFTGFAIGFRFSRIAIGTILRSFRHCLLVAGLNTRARIAAICIQILDWHGRIDLWCVTGRDSDCARAITGTVVNNVLNWSGANP